MCLLALSAKEFSTVQHASGHHALNANDTASGASEMHFQWLKTHLAAT